MCNVVVGYMCASQFCILSRWMAKAKYSESPFENAIIRSASWVTFGVVPFNVSINVEGTVDLNPHFGSNVSNRS